MHDSDAFASASSSFSSSAAGRSLRYAVRMPIDGSADSVDAAVEKLLSCDRQELRRARRHHRRALAALENGSYETLSDSTRTDLIERLRRDLEALDRALHQSQSAARSPGREHRDPECASASESSADESPGGRAETGSGWELPFWP